MSGEGGKAPRRVDVRRRQKKIVDELINLPREHEALEFAMAAFGSSFELAALKQALRPNAEMELYSKVQALERAITRVQNKAQKTRNRIEHDYDKVTAGQLHEVAEEVRDLSREFLRPFRDWIEPRL